LASSIIKSAPAPSLYIGKKGGGEKKPYLYATTQRQEKKRGDRKRNRSLEVSTAKRGAGGLLIEKEKRKPYVLPHSRGDTQTSPRLVQDPRLATEGK